MGLISYISSMNDTVVIYTLEHPITNEIRYVGKTLKRRFKKRYKAHCNPHKKADGNTHKVHWVNKLKKDNLKPLMKVIDSTNDKDWGWLEEYWIAQFKSWGCRLINMTNGGEDPPKCTGNSMDTRKKMRESRTDIKTINVYNNLKFKREGRRGPFKIVSKDLVGTFVGINQFIKNYVGLDRYDDKKEFHVWSSKIAAICTKKVSRHTHKGYNFEYTS